MKNVAKKLKFWRKKIEFFVLIDFYFHLLLHLTHSSENHLQKSVLENNGCPVDFNFENYACPVDFNLENNGCPVDFENIVCPVDFNFENTVCPVDFNFENSGCPFDFNFKTGPIRLKWSHDFQYNDTRHNDSLRQ
jgi:hypothetical protein